jgi:hypothetical protein
LKTIEATPLNTKKGRLVIHKYLCDMDNQPRLALVVEEDDGYGDVGVSFQEYAHLTYYFELKNLLLIED